jgi:hypothetical protein
MMKTAPMKPRETKVPLTIFTIGHSTRPIDEFLDLLRARGIRQLLDIRTIPKSRRNPQFNTDALAASLAAAKIRYVHMKELGGLRHAARDSVNLGWRNASFRGYADYMQTPAFAQALDRASISPRRRHRPCSCAPKPSPGAAIARSSPTRSSSAASASSKSSAPLPPRNTRSRHSPRSAALTSPTPPTSAPSSIQRRSDRQPPRHNRSYGEGFCRGGLQLSKR